MFCEFIKIHFYFMLNTDKLILGRNFLNKILETVFNHKMIKHGDRVLIGVSGGPDSVALCFCLCLIADKFNLAIGVAHLNHCLRGADSDRDAEFVSDLSKKLNIPFFLKKTDVNQYKKRSGLSLEEAARTVRYDFFLKTSEKNSYNKIALGHHKNDNAELILMYLFRGSGLLGAAGIPPVRDEFIIRPFIDISKNDIMEFLSLNNLKYVSDASNKDTIYLRNKIRHELIPLLKKEYNPKITESLTRFANVIKKENQWIDTMIEPLFEKYVFFDKNSHVALSTKELKKKHTAVKRRIIRKALEKARGNLRKVQLVHVDLVIKLMNNSHSEKRLDLPDIKVIQKNSTLYFLPAGFKQISCKKMIFSHYFVNQIKDADIFLNLKETGATLKFSCVHKADGELSYEKSTAFMDFNKVKFPLLIRNFKPGDRFIPFGMEGCQKLKKFFNNNKISKKTRAECPLVESDGKIIWIAGYRISNCVKIDRKTEKVLKIQLFLHDI